MNYHEPVLLKEVMENLRIEKGKRYIDATFGGGGHGVEILKRGGKLLGIDTDTEAIAYSKEKLESGNCPPAGEAGKLEEKNKWKIVQGNFRNITDIARVHNFYPVDGILFDLGVSSHQLDAQGRGFSYRYADAPLDLRLNQTEGTSAADIVNHETEETLIHIFETFGEEESGRLIAHALILARQVKPIATTGDVYKVVEKVAGKGRAKETASRIFQSIRIAVNDELQALREGLLGAEQILTKGGRLCVISYHSLEDRMVKQFFLDKTVWEPVTKKPITPSQTEQEQNRRSRSAKLRVATKL